MRVSLDGGAAEPIAGADFQARGATWGRDDSIIYAKQGKTNPPSGIPRYH